MIPQDPSQADPSVVALMHGIKTNEGTNGNYDGSGDKGTAAGIGQWSNQVNGIPQPLQKGQIPANFQNQAKQYGLDPQDFSPENQNKVMYATVAADKKSGLSPEQVLSKWNSGDPNKYLNSATSTGNGPVGKYDVAAYVKNGMTAAQQYAQQRKQAPDSPSQAPQDSRGTLEKVFDWAFPIAQDFSGEGAKKTALQKLGDAGLSALWFLPGLGELGEGLRGAGAVAEGAKALEGGEAVAKASGLLPKVLKGAASGYGADVASNLSQGKTGSDVFTPGLGAVTGGALEGVLGKIGSKYSQSGVLKDLTESNNSILGQTKRGANDLAESFAEGKNPGELISHKGINLASEYNPETLGFDTASHAADMRKSALVLTDSLTEALKKVAGKTTATELESGLLAKIASEAPDKITASEQAQLIKDEFSKIRSLYGENLSAADLNELKKRAWLESNFDASKTNLYRRTQRKIGNSLKTSVESLAEKGGLGGVKEFNNYIGSHLDAADTLERLNGTKVKGGRLGDLMRKHSLAAAGGIGGFFGAGPVGSLAGALVGEYAGGKLSNVLRKIESSPIKSAILKKMEQEDPEAVQKVLQYAQQESPMVKKLREEMASQGFSLGGTEKVAQKGSVAPELKPRAPKPSKIVGLIKSAGVRSSVQTKKEESRSK